MDPEKLSDSCSDHPEDVDINDGPSVEVVYPVGEQTEVPNTKGGLFKTVLVEGTGSRPPKGAKVSVHYVGTLESDGSKFDSSRDRNELFDFTLGQGQVIKGWDQGVATMRIGEKAVLKCTAEFGYGAAGSPPKIPPNATLLFEVELFDWTKSEDVSAAKDKSILKSTLQEGKDWDKPEYETECTVEVSVLAPGPAAGKEGAVLGTKSHWHFVVGEAELPPGLEQALKSMKKSEVALFEIAASVTSSNGNAAASSSSSGVPLTEFIPQGQKFAYKISLTDMKKLKTWEVKGSAKVEAGRTRKDQGNEYFKQKKFSDAIAKYKRSLEFIEHDYGLEDADKEEAKKIKVACFSNLAQAHLSSGNLSEAVTYCNKCLEAEPGNLKALFRRGKCYNQQDKWEESRADLKKVLELDPSNGDAANELRALDTKVKSHRQKEKALFGNMFEKLHKMEEREQKANPAASAPAPQTSTETAVKTEEEQAEAAAPAAA